MTKRSGLVCALVVASLLAGAGVLRAQCTTPTGDTGFNDVIYSPNTGTFGGVLPFDVPLRVCAEVPAGTTRATVEVAATGRKLGPIDVDPASCVIRTPGVRWGPVSERVPTGTTVHWLLGKLEAERYYVFCFRFFKTATDAEVAAFRQGATKVLDDTIAQVAPMALDLDSGQTQAICTGLKAQLTAATGADQVLAHGTIFDCDPAEVKTFSAEVISGPMVAQRAAHFLIAGVPNDNPILASPSLGQRQSELQEQLAALQADASLGKLVTAIAQQSALDPTLAARAQSLCPTCSSLLGPGSTPADRLARGETATSPPGPPITVQSPAAQPAAMAPVYSGLAKTLTDLRNLVNWATAGDAPPGITAALSDADRESLSAMAAEPGPLVGRGSASARANGLASVAQSLDKDLADRAAGIDRLTAKLGLEIKNLQLADASTLGNFTTNQNNYISLDAGLTWAPEIEEVVPYMGTNIYFRPVNRNAPLRSLGNFRQTFSRRFSMTLGLTLSSIADENSNGGSQDDLFGNQSLMLGAGLRLTDAMRIGAGAIVFKQDDPSPLINEQKLNTSYYLSFSFDIDVVNLFSKPLASAFGVKPAGGS